jgi:hypothetical protein
MSVDKAALLARRLGEGEHEIPGFGTVKIRALSRADVIEIQSLTDVAESDRKTLARALVDPALTEDEVKIWQEHSLPLEIERVIDAIRDLSGMGKDAGKSGVPRV